MGSMIDPAAEQAAKDVKRLDQKGQLANALLQDVVKATNGMAPTPTDMLAARLDVLIDYICPPHLDGDMSREGFTNPDRIEFEMEYADHVISMARATLEELANAQRKLVVPDVGVANLIKPRKGG